MRDDDLGCFTIYISMAVLFSCIECGTFWPLIILAIVCISCYIYIGVKDLVMQYKEGRDAIKEVHRLKKVINDLEHERDMLNKRINYLVTTAELTMRSKAPFKYTATMVADLRTIIFDEGEDYLRQKRHPAIKTAEVVAALRTKSHDAIRAERELTYRLEILYSQYPILKDYINQNEEDIKGLYRGDNLRESYDYARDYLTQEEYKKLSQTERNQLALDRYVERRKSNWCIGRDYELCCAYVLEKQGYTVARHGIEKKLDDLGRDIIAQREIAHIGNLFESRYEVLIVQCKYWRGERIIHENIINQLFGTTIAYKAENYDKRDECRIVPVLMIPSTSVLSDTAQKFIKILDIKVIRQDMVDFPRIKCNINGGQKIYHLPFDQQYDRTIIKDEGEFYAYTVAEAEGNGFRRAFRHIVN